MTSTDLSHTPRVEPEPSAAVPHTPRLPHLVIVRAPSLLPMWYSRRELAQELEVSVSAIQWWIEQGLPCRRDERGHVWIDGRQFAIWVNTVTRQRSRQALQAHEAYCLNCRRPVALLDPTSICRGKQRLMRGNCSVCGHIVYRAVRHG
jgi:hypothetical protein